VFVYWTIFAFKFQVSHDYNSLLSDSIQGEQFISNCIINNINAVLYWVTRNIRNCVSYKTPEPLQKHDSFKSSTISSRVVHTFGSLCNQSLLKNRNISFHVRFHIQVQRHNVSKRSVATVAFFTCGKAGRLSAGSRNTRTGKESQMLAGFCQCLEII
jgi:hypothetical protein